MFKTPKTIVGIDTLSTTNKNKVMRFKKILQAYQFVVRPRCTGNATAPTPGHCCPVGVPQEASPRPPEGLYTLIPSGQQI